MSSWREVILQDVVEKFIDYRGKTPEKTTSGIPLVTAKIVKNGTILQPNEFVSKETYKEFMTRGFPKINDVVLTTEAPLGEVALLKDDSVALAQRIILMRGKKDVLDNAYLKYFLQSEEGQYRLDSRASGTTVFGIKASVLKEMPILIPALEEQKAIAEVLSSLDDKIDLLHRQNQTLESLAQTLFRQWFIEEAKEKWEEKPLSEIALHVKNNVKPSSFENKSFYHFSLPAFDNGQRATKELGSEILSNKYQVIKNSILVSKLNPRTPRIWLIDENIDEDNSICSTEFQVLYPKEENWRGFIYCYLKTEQAVQELAGASSGTSGSHQRVKPEDIFNLTFQYPDIDTLKRFDEQSSVYWRKIKVNQKQIQTLENLRDTLLPKLLSGEVMVGNA